MWLVLFGGPGVSRMRKRHGGQCRRECLVVFLDLPVAEQRAVAGAARGIGGEQHESRRVAVDAMQRYEVPVAKAMLQSRQQRFPHMATDGRDRQEVRLVGDDQIGVDMQQRFRERNHWFVGDFTEVTDLGTHPEWRVERQRNACGVQDASTQETIDPRVMRDTREPVAQAIEHRHPRTGWQLQSAGAEWNGDRHRDVRVRQRDIMARARPRFQKKGPACAGPCPWGRDSCVS